METFLVMNGHELAASVDHQEAVFLQLAAGSMNHVQFADWVRLHVASCIGCRSVILAATRSLRGGGGAGKVAVPPTAKLNSFRVVPWLARRC
jgi:hypothetical protein